MQGIHFVRCSSERSSVVIVLSVVFFSDKAWCLQHATQWELASPSNAASPTAQMWHKASDLAVWWRAQVTCDRNHWWSWFLRNSCKLCWLFLKPMPKKTHFLTFQFQQETPWKMSWMHLALCTTLMIKVVSISSNWAENSPVLRGTRYRKTAAPISMWKKPRFLYEQNGYFEQVGVKQLSNGHRYLAGKVPNPTWMKATCIMCNVTLWNSVHIIRACIALIYL